VVGERWDGRVLGYLARFVGHLLEGGKPGAGCLCRVRVVVVRAGCVCCEVEVRW